MKMNLSARERNIWIDVITSLIIGLYYLKYLLKIENWSGIWTGDIKSFIYVVVAVAIASSVLKFAGISKKDAMEAADERDILMAAKAAAAAYYTLMTLIIAFIGHLVFAHTIWQIFAFAEFLNSPVAVAHVLLLIVMITSIVKGFSQLYYYKRGH